MIINEDLGFNKKIAKFDKCIDKLENKNNKHIPKNDKQKEYKKELKNSIKILRSNSKELKRLNNYDFEDKEQKKLAKKVIKKLIQNQINFITGINNSGFIGFLKELGLGTAAGAILGGFAYLLNNQSFNDRGTLILCAHRPKEVLPPIRTAPVSLLPAATAAAFSPLSSCGPDSR